MGIAVVDAPAVVEGTAVLVVVDVGCSDVLYLVEERTVEELAAILVAEETAE